ncbi:hypothetical protein EUX98_g3389 [Antrodiella citrinella]|uniref:Uncharacterized protein n=1 Tax=Antrodiella citrinella TaxID=2447956 RepID=A0A4S4MXU6_9APHY|nr:hypothetical protein EUX98_g3389 [Antrodiella citrinella]
MSAVGSSSPPDMMRTYMLRSTTPASNEKVLLYLEGMQRAPPAEEENDNASLLRSPKARSAVSSRRLEQLAAEGNEDIRSDVQEGNGSELARTIPIQTTGNPDHEPGPDDPPGPRFESYGSSFGNFGPLRDSLPPANGNGWAAQTPSKAAGVPLPETNPPGSPTQSHPNPFQQYGMAPANPAGIPLPASVLSGQNAKSRTGTPSRASNKSPDVLSNGGPARAMSPARTNASQAKSRATQKTSRTAYPPLPESNLEDPPMSPTQRGISPPPRHQNRSPSIGPSESASQVRPRRQTQPAANPSHKPSRSLKSIMEVGESVESHQGGSRAGGPSQRDARSPPPTMPLSPRSHASQPLSRNGLDELQRAAATMSPGRSVRRSNLDPEATPRAGSPVGDLDAEEEQLVNTVLSARPAKSRTSYAFSAATSMLEPDVQNSHFHDGELCQLLHALDDRKIADSVKKAVRKAVRARVKKLGMKYDNESIKQYRKSFHDHDPSVHMMGMPQQEWAKDLIDGMINMRERLDTLAPKIERSLRTSRGESFVTEGRSYRGDGQDQYAQSEQNGGYSRSALTQTTQILANQRTGTMADESMFHGDTEPPRDSTHLNTLPGSMHHHDGSLHGAIPEEDEMYEDEEQLQGAQTEDGDTHRLPSEWNDRTDSPGKQYLEEELYKLRIKPHTGSQSVAATHKTWELARDNGEDYDDDGDAQAAVTESGIPEIPDGATGYTERRSSPPLPPIPMHGEVAHHLPEPHLYAPGDYGGDRGPSPYQRVHQRLLSWAIVWPMGELDNALNSTTRGMQVDEIALSIWSTQTYKRYVRAKMTDSPPGRVDRLFVPPNMADAISTAVYNGRHGDACGMLRDLWAPFGLDGIPRLLIVLAKHRTDESHWVVHRFSLPDGSLTTYDTYPEKCLPDGRPLGWWFAIRIAWPDAAYPSPDHLMQKMVRLHRPMQLGIDNSVAAAGIWRNLLMGSRAERSLDLERLRDLINTEVKNLRQRKQMGKLSIGSPRPNWEDMA